MGHADLARLWNGSAAHQSGIRDCMVRGREGPCGREPGQQASHRMDACGFQALLEGHGRQDCGDAFGQHRLAGPRRPHKKPLKTSYTLMAIASKKERSLSACVDVVSRGESVPDSPYTQFQRIV